MQPSATIDYSPDSTVIVSRGGSDVQSGTNLLAAYTAAKALLPGGAALSATNWATLLIPPGGYDMGAAAWAINGQFVRLVSQAKVQPMAVFAGGRTPVRIYTAGGGHCLAIQSVDYVEMDGLTFENLGTTLSTATDGTGFTASDNGLHITVTNTNSSYHACWFSSGAAGSEATAYRYGCSGVTFAPAATGAGTWSYCYSNAHAWRVGPSKNLSATMDWCQSTNNSFGGDATAAAITGTLRDCVGALECFCGCSVGAGSISSTAILKRCTAGNNSFGMGNLVDGKLTDCVGGDACFGGASTATARTPGWIGPNAVLTRCVASGLSFGAGLPSSSSMTADTARDAVSPAVPEGSGSGWYGVQGTLIDCENLSMAVPIRLCGGKLRGCRFKVTTTGVSAIILGKTGSQIRNCELAGMGAASVITNLTTDVYATYGNQYSAHQWNPLTSANCRKLLPIKAATVVTITYVNAASEAKTITIDASDVFSGDDLDAGGTNTIDRANGVIKFKQTSNGSSSSRVYANYTIDDLAVEYSQNSDNALGFASGVTNTLAAAGGASDAAFTL